MPTWLTWRLDELPTGNMQAGLIGLVAVGVLYCFLGYRLFKFTILLTGFLLAAVSATVLGGWVSQGNLVVMGFGFLLGGVCGAMALFWLYRAGVFLLGLFGALLAAYNVLQGRPEPWAPWAIAGIGLAGGLLALAIERPTMTLATAAIGAWLIVYVAAFLLIETGFEELTKMDGAVSTESASGGWLFGAWVALLVLGAATQFFLTGRRKKKRA